MTQDVALQPEKYMTDFYGEELTREYRDIRFIQPGWRESLARRGVKWILVPPDAPLAAALPLLMTLLPLLPLRR